MPNGTATTVYFLEMYGNYFAYVDTQTLPGVIQPVCVNGYVESNGVCNCFSGYVVHYCNIQINRLTPSVMPRITTRITNAALVHLSTAL